jgi:hypothetical protein
MFDATNANGLRPLNPLIREALKLDPSLSDLDILTRHFSKVELKLILTEAPQ